MIRGRKFLTTPKPPSNKNEKCRYYFLFSTLPDDVQIIVKYINRINSINQNKQFYVFIHLSQLVSA